MNIKRNSKINRNLGLEFLRTILCLWIIIFHFLKQRNCILYFVKKKKYHVPCFFIISFYFLYPTIKERNIAKMKLRLERLLIPYIAWPLIIWAINNLLFAFFQTNQFKRTATFNDLKIQLLLGRKFMGHLWYMFHLIFFNIIFFILSLLVGEERFLFIFIIAAILSYIAQYSSLNHNYFCKYNDSISHSLGYMAETIPFIISSFLLSSLNIIEKLKKHRIQSLIIFFMSLYLFLKYKIFSDIIAGNSYKGIDKNIISIFIFIEFYLIPFDCLESTFFNKLLSSFTRFTQGIYCIQYSTTYIMSLIFHAKGTLFGCILTYIIGYLISYIGIKIVGTSKLKHLF